MNSSGAVTGAGGTVAVTGAGGSGSGGSHRGIILDSGGAVTSTGATTITITGTGGTGGGANDDIYTTGGANVIGGASDTGAITLVANSLSLSNLSVQTTGNVTLKPRTASTTIGVAGGAGTLGVTSAILNSITAGSITVGRSDGTGALIANAYTWNSDATLLTGTTGGITVNGAQAVGAHNLTLQADSDIALNANLSGSGALTVKPSSVGTTFGLGGGAGTLNLSSADLTRLVDGWSSITIGRSDGTGAMAVNAATWSDPLNLYTGTGGIGIDGAQAMNGNAFLARTYGASDITIGASGSVTSSAANTAITLASGRNFINSAGSGALSAPSGRWLVYSTNPASDTIGSLSNAFRRFTCAYGGACPAFPAAGNGLLYSYTPTLTATPSGLSITYGDAAPNLNGYAYTLSGYLGSDSSADAVTGTLVGTTTYTQGNNAGTYNITYGSGTLASDLGYGFSYASSATDLTVNKKALTATADDKSRLYGDANPAFTVSYSGFYGADTAAVLDTAPTASTAATSSSNVGTYAITPAGGSDNNYSFSYINGTLTVGKAHLSVTADDKSKTYGDANPAFTATLSGFVNGEVLATSGVTGSAALASAANAASHAGTYAITAAQGTLAASNYDFTTFNNGTLTVGKKALSVTADDKSKTYGDANPALTVSYSGFLTGEAATVLDTAPTASTAASAASNAGTYAITAAGGLDGDYSFSYVPGTLTVGKKGLTVTADDKGKVHGTPNPPLTVSYTGFVGGDDGTVLDTAPTASTTATDTSTAGAYAITAAGGVDNNYDFTYIDGLLTVMPEHGSGHAAPEGETGTGTDHEPGGGPAAGDPTPLSGSTPFLPSTTGMTLPATVMRGADALTEERRMGHDTAMWDGFSKYTASESEDDPFDAAAPPSEKASPDDAPISILGGLVQIAPKLARALGLAKSRF